MAEFCQKCADELGFEPDLTIKKLKMPLDYAGRFLCEGCGFIYIENADGVELVYRTEEQSCKSPNFKIGGSD